MSTVKSLGISDANFEASAGEKFVYEKSTLTQE